MLVGVGRDNPRREDLRRCAGRRLAKVRARQMMEIDFDRNRTLLHAFFEDDRVGIKCKNLICFFRQFRWWNVHGDDLTWLDLFRDVLLCRL